jgi:SAM-dependent methyltransferase
MPVGVDERVRELGRRAFETIMWARVGVQIRLAGRRTGTRPIPEMVPPTAVLKTEAQWRAAVDECRRLGLPLHHQREKNWDALGAVGAILSRTDSSAAILDAGSARYSPVLPWFRLYGYSRLTGVNLEFSRETRHGPVVFRRGNITDTDFGDGSLDAVTCMSVVEHGVPIDPFLTEMARVIRPGGLLCVSTDYARNPPPTTGLTAYGQPVKIFGPEGVLLMVETAAGLGLKLVGTLDLDHSELPVYWKRMDLRYTFILLTFERVSRGTDLVANQRTEIIGRECR